MKDSIFEIACPCCGAQLEVDGSAEVVISHVAPKTPQRVQDLRKAVRDLEADAVERDQRFTKQMANERRHGDQLSAKFDSLLEKQRGKPVTRPGFRDIDLD